METAYCLSLTLLLAAPLAGATQDDVDSYDSYSYSAEGDAEETEEGVVLPSAPRPAATEVKDILDDNYHMFRRKRGAGRAENYDEQGNHVPVFHNFELKSGLRHQRIKEDKRVRYLLKKL